MENSAIVILSPYAGTFDKIVDKILMTLRGRPFDVNYMLFFKAYFWYSGGHSDIISRFGE